MAELKEFVGSDATAPAVVAQSTPDQPAAACPFRSQAAPAPEPVRLVAREDRLRLPLHKSAIRYFDVNEDGDQLYYIHHRDHDISFDEPDLHNFAQEICRQGEFVAGDCLNWAPGVGWTRLQQTLQDLVDAEVLYFVDALGADLPLAIEAGVRPSPLPAAPCAQPRMWGADGDLMRDLTGRPFDPAHLELVVPIFRLVHPALDADGRQVGEANVFPKALRLETPTRWRTCLFEGSRHQPDKPMNVTALKAMGSYWGAMMRVLAEVRAAYLARFPEARAGWTVAHVERLAASALAVPAWLMMRPVDPVANGDLHPALSCVFRVTDGVRMVTHQMMFVPGDEPMRRPDDRVSARDIHRFAERTGSFHSEHGVCAGPAAMVEEFLGVLIDGREPAGGFPSDLSPQIVEALNSVDHALDYALLGLQGHAAIFSLWPAMAGAYDAMADAAARLPDGSPVRQALADIQTRLKRSTYLGQAEHRAHRDVVYADMFATSARGLDGRWPTPSRLPHDAARLGPAERDVLDHAVRSAVGDDAVTGAAISSAIEAFIGRGRRLLAVAEEAQAVLSSMLGRPPAARAFTSQDADLHNRLQGEAERRVPFLPDAMDVLFNIRIEFDAHGARIEPGPAIQPPEGVGSGR